MQLDGFENEQLLDSRLFAWQGEQMSAAKTEQSDFLEQVAEGTPSPGGGSAAAHTGALAAALAAMVGRLTVGKPKYAEVEAETWQIIARAEALRKELTEAIDLDAQAFDGILQARRLPKLTESQQQARSEAITKATLHAARVPLETAGKCLAVMKLAARMAEIGNLNAISDAGAGAQLAAAAFRSAALNVRINLLGMENEPEPARILAELDNLQGEAEGVLSSVQESLAKRAGLRA